MSDGTAMGVSTADQNLTDAAYRALATGVVLVDRSDRLRMRFSGAKAAESLTGLVTNDVTALVPGSGHYAAALTNKGKVLADVRVFAGADSLLVDVPPAAAPGWTAMIRKFVNPRLARYEDISADTGDLGVAGGGAAQMLHSVLGVDDPASLAPYAHVSLPGDDPVMIARVPDFGIDGFDLIGARQALAAVRSKLLEAGALPEPGDALRVTRIEAGRPEYGVDMDESFLAQEADLERLEAISFTKGCYTGQETVARVHYRGHVNRLLRGLRLPGAVPPPPGTELQDRDEKAVGVTKSSAVSPRLGTIALAIVRREVEPGTTLRALVDGRVEECTVSELPFSS